MDKEPEISLSLGISGVQEAFPMKIEGWTEESARSMLKMGLGDKDCERIMRLESKSAQTRLTDGEQAELDGYDSVSVFLEFLKRCAREHLASPAEESSRSRLVASRTWGVESSDSL